MNAKQYPHRNYQRVPAAPVPRLRPGSILLALLACLAAGCGDPAPGPATRDETARVRPVGRRLATELQTRLRGELLRALEAGGPAGAVAVCAERAATLAEEAGRGEPPARLRRVSRRLRSPANAPDAWDRQALEHYELAAAAGRPLPEEWVQRLEGPRGRAFRYYQPITVGEPCLLCHGDPGSMPDTLRAALAARYPGDAATGYRLGDLRGLLRVEIDADDLPKDKAGS